MATVTQIQVGDTLHDIGTNWGKIGGTISNQTDLNKALAAKADKNSLGGLATANDAPSDGNYYARKDGAWLAIANSGGSSTASVAWGAITGNIASQQDLQNALSSISLSTKNAVITDTDDDTTANWTTTGNGFFYYEVAGQLNGQPTTYGILYNIVHSGGRVSQIWIAIPGGEIYTRGGNSSGWSSNGWINNSSNEDALLKNAAHQNVDTDGVLDALTDGTALVKTTSSVNASLYNALGDTFAYVLQMSYDAMSETARRVQIAYPYNKTVEKCAWRIYNGGWGDWHVLSISDFLTKAGGTLTGQLKRAVTAGSYIQARNNAIIRGTSTSNSSSYAPAVAMKTGSGNWSIGVINEVIGFRYDTDANFDSQTNTTSGVTINSSGEFSGKAANVTGIVAIENGGTGKTKAADAWKALGGGAIGKKDTLAAADIPNLAASKITSGTLPVARGGTGGTDAATARSNIGAVNVAGDTMTGDLKLKNGTMDISTTPSAAQYRTIIFEDKNARYPSFIQVSESTAGKVEMKFCARRYNSSANADNSFTLGVDASGNRTVALSHAASWRTALGGICARENYGISTTDLTAGTSALTTGKIYLVYE